MIFTNGTINFTLYGDYTEPDNSRTIAYVATAAYNDRSETETEVYKYFVETENNYSRYNLSALAQIKIFADAYPVE